MCRAPPWVPGTRLWRMEALPSCTGLPSMVAEFAAQLDLLLDFSTSASVRGHHSSLFPASSASTGARVKLWAVWTTLTQRTHFLGMGTPIHEPSLGKIRAHFRASFALSLFRVLKTPL